MGDVFLGDYLLCAYRCHRKGHIHMLIHAQFLPLGVLLRTCRDDLFRDRLHHVHAAPRSWGPRLRDWWNHHTEAGLKLRYRFLEGMLFDVYIGLYIEALRRDWPILHRRDD